MSTTRARPSVVIRHGHTVDSKGFIHYNEEPSTHEHAQTLTTHRIDRRKNYLIIDGIVCQSVSYVTTCSGCHETCDGHPVGKYPFDPKHHIHLGSGCSECGYRGKVIRGHWDPVDPADMDRFLTPNPADHEEDDDE